MILTVNAIATKTITIKPNFKITTKIIKARRDLLIN